MSEGIDSGTAASLATSIPAETPARLNILLVEDDPGDALMIREALSEADGDIRLHVVADGTEALALLHSEQDHDTAPRPGLILLDLNLPGLDGRELLTHIKTNEDLHPIPVVVLTCSHAEQDVTDSYGAHANAYITKPIDAADFTSVVRQIKTFFTTIVKLPR